MANNQPTKQPIEQGIIARAVAGVRYAFTGNTDWFGPMQTPEPLAPEDVQGRRFDYPVGINLNSRPRNNEGVSFAQLRALAENYDILRLVIETRKDQLAKLSWTIKPKDEKAEPDQRCADAIAFFQSPDKENTWDGWLRMLLEDLFVIDAPTLYVRKTRGGDVYSLDPIDGATIKRVLDASGRTPMSPDPAYQQILKGVPAVNYTREELIYRPRNPRTNRVYGYSPVEQIINTVNIALRRQLAQLNYFTEGNMPDYLVGVPSEWNVDQIEQFQKYWDLLHKGNVEQRAGAKFTPGEIAKNVHEVKQPPLKDEFDEWLARVACFAFSINPTPFIKQQNRATAENATEQALTEGLAPIQNWIKSIIDGVLVMHFGMVDYEFAWAEEEAIDPLVQAQINQIYLTAKVLHPDEVRAELGREPLTPEQQEDLNPEPPPQLGGDEVASDGKEIPKKQDATDKVVKKKSIAPIDRKRPAVMDAVAGLTGDIKEFLASQAIVIARQIDELLAQKINKVDEPSEPAEPPIYRDAEVVSGALSFTDWGNRLPDIFHTHLEPIIIDGVQMGFLQIDIDPTPDMLDLANERAVEFARNRGAELVGRKWVDGVLIDNPNPKWAITESTRDMVRKAILEAMKEGWSGDTLKQRLMDDYAFSESRASMIARTECAYADAHGNLEAYIASGVVEGKRSILSNRGEHGVDDVLNAEQGVIPLAQEFQSGHQTVPYHPHCQCDVLPVLAEDMPKEALEKYNHNHDEKGKFSSISVLKDFLGKITINKENNWSKHHICKVGSNHPIAGHKLYFVANHTRHLINRHGVGSNDRHPLTEKDLFSVAKLVGLSKPVKPSRTSALGLPTFTGGARIGNYYYRFVIEQRIGKKNKGTAAILTIRKRPIKVS